MILRDARPADAEAVAALYGHWVLHGTGSFEAAPPCGEEMAARMVAVVEAGLPWLIAEADGVLLGYAYAAPYRARVGYRFACEDSIYVAPGAGGRGVGSTLLRELMECCRVLGRPRMIASIGDGGNSASVRLHARCGFRPAGRLERVGFKFDRWLDVVLMQADLDEA